MTLCIFIHGLFWKCLITWWMQLTESVLLININIPTSAYGYWYTPLEYINCSLQQFCLYVCPMLFLMCILIHFKQALNISVLLDTIYVLLRVSVCCNCRFYMPFCNLLRNSSYIGWLYSFLVLKVHALCTVSLMVSSQHVNTLPIPLECIVHWVVVSFPDPLLSCYYIGTCFFFF